MTDSFDPMDDVRLLDTTIEPPSAFRARLREDLVASFGDATVAADRPARLAIVDDPPELSPRASGGGRRSIWLAVAAALVLLLGLAGARSFDSGGQTSETNEPELGRPTPTNVAEICATFEQEAPVLAAIEAGAVPNRVEAIRELASATDRAAADLTRLGLISGAEQQAFRLVIGSLTEAAADLEAGEPQAASAAIDFAFTELAGLTSIEVAITAEERICR